MHGMYEKEAPQYTFACLSRGKKKVCVLLASRSEAPPFFCHRVIRFARWSSFHELLYLIKQKYDRQEA